MKSRTFYSAIAVVAGLLVLIGLAGFWGLTAQNPRSLLARGGQAVPTAAQFVPRQAPLMASLLARPDRLWQLRQVLTPSRRRYAARQEWQALQQSLEETLGWRYDTDLRPWLDQEVTFAVTTTDLDRSATNGLQPGYLAVLSCRDAAAAQEALHLLWQQRAATGRSLVFETVSGISLIYDQPPTDGAFQGLEGLSLGTAVGPNLASAMVGDRYVLLANSPQVLREAIATSQAPDVSLARAANYRAALAKLPPQRIGWLYANVPNLLTWLGLAEGAAPQPIAAAGQAANSLFVSWRAFPAGLLGDTAIAAAPGDAFGTSSAPLPSALPALGLLPPETVFATAGTDLAQRLADLKAAIGGYDITQRSFQALLAALSLPTADLPPDLWVPLQQEYALGTLPGADAPWVLVTKGTAEPPFAAIDAFAQGQGINVSQVPLGDRTITTWTRLTLTRTAPNRPLTLATQVVGVHTMIDGYGVLANSLAGLQQVLENSPTASLVKAPAFTQLTANLGETTDTLAYVNWPAVAPTLTRRLPWLRALEQAGQPLTAHLGPMVLSSYGGTAALQEGAIAIKLLETP